MPDAQAQYDALQQRVMGMQSPMTPRTKLQESIIDAIPLAISAFDESGQSTDLVFGIMDRRRRQQDLAFQNELALRELQLNAAYKGIQNQRDELETTKRLALTDEQIAGAKQEREQSSEMFPLRKTQAQSEIDVAKERLAGVKQEREQSAAKFPVEMAGLRENIKTSRSQRQLAEDTLDLREREFQAEAAARDERVAASKSERQKYETEAKMLEQKFKVADEMLHSADPTEVSIAKAALLTGELPRSGKTEDLVEWGAARNPRIAALNLKSKRQDLSETEMDEMTTLLTNESDPNRAVISPILTPIIQDLNKFRSMQKTKAGEKLNADNSKIFLDRVINYFTPYYRKLKEINPKAEMVLDEELQSIIEVSTTKMSAAQLKKKIVQNSIEFETEEGQKKFLENSLKDVLQIPSVENREQTAKDQAQQTIEQMRKETGYSFDWRDVGK